MVFDPRDGAGADHLGPVAIEIPGKTAELLIKLAGELGASTPGQVVAQALGVLQMVRAAKARGQRVVLKGADGREIDLAL
jgi:hypothetical protein